MKTPKRAAELLVAGTLERSVWPELEEEDFAREVRTRLETVGLELVGAGGKWLARSMAMQDDDTEGFDPTHHLHAVELAMVAALYLHLRWLPNQEAGIRPQEEPSVEVEDIVRAFPGYKQHYLEMVVGHLRNAGFVRREEGRLYAGPYLAAMDGVRADERANEALRNFVLRRYLRRRVQEVGVDASD